MTFLPHHKYLNHANLLRMAEYIETIPQSKFGMSDFRTGNPETTECDSVGCVIGHCTVLAPELVDQVRFVSGRIDFKEFIIKFIGFGIGSAHGHFLFGGDWWMYDNTPTGAAKRIRYYLKNGLPENWEDYPLDYQNETI